MLNRCVNRHAGPELSVRWSWKAEQRLLTPGPQPQPPTSALTAVARLWSWPLKRATDKSACCYYDQYTTHTSGTDVLILFFFLSEQRELFLSALTVGTSQTLLESKMIWGVQGTHRSREGHWNSSFLALWPPFCRQSIPGSPISCQGGEGHCTRSWGYSCPFLVPLCLLLPLTCWAKLTDPDVHLATLG